MEALEQLKVLRGEALTRLQNNVDYKLMTTLDRLIIDIETVTEISRPKFMIIDEEDINDDTDVENHEETIDEAFEKMTAELESDDATDDDEEENEKSRPVISFS
ncbi:MAG: hypothetical protein AAF478_02495 [Pseudomonadota bacterium]